MASSLDANLVLATIRSLDLGSLRPTAGQVLTCSASLATKQDIENHFNSHGTGEITEVKLMNGFGFIEYKDAMDARDIVPGKSSIQISKIPRLNMFFSFPYVFKSPSFLPS
jgi:hypothetical protein